MLEVEPTGRRGRRWPPKVSKPAGHAVSPSSGRCIPQSCPWVRFV